MDHSQSKSMNNNNVTSLLTHFLHCTVLYWVIDVLVHFKSLTVKGGTWLNRQGGGGCAADCIFHVGVRYSRVQCCAVLLEGDDGDDEWAVRSFY